MEQKKKGKNIVLDLDATLIHTQDSSSEDMKKLKALKLYSDPKMAHLRHRIYILDLIDVDEEETPPGTGSVCKFVGIFRPYSREFVRYCFRNFDNVVVWSAGLTGYVHQICDYLFPKKDYPVLVLTRPDCEIDDLDQVEKPLEKLFREYPEFNAKNTVLIDDREDTIEFNGDNGIMIPPFVSELSKEYLESKRDDCLVKLMCWFSLSEFKDCEDVRKLDKTKIFTTKMEEYKQKQDEEKKKN